MAWDFFKVWYEMSIQWHGMLNLAHKILKKTWPTNMTIPHELRWLERWHFWQNTQEVLTRTGRLTQICDSEQGHHCFIKCLVVESPQSHYLKQCGLYVNWTLGNISSVKVDSNNGDFNGWKCIRRGRLQNGISPSLSADMDVSLKTTLNKLLDKQDCCCRFETPTLS